MDKHVPRSAPPRAAERAIQQGTAASTLSEPSQTPPQGSAPAKAASGSARPWSMAKEISYVTFGCLGSILGILFFLFSLGFLIGSRYMENVINDIGATNFTKQMERIDHYTSFFEALQANGYKVVREDPEIDQGVIYYLWQVAPPGSDEARVFRWRHDLAGNAVEPLNNPALLLDIKLGYIKTQEAAAWKFGDPGQKFDPGDTLAQAMVNNDFSMINPADIAGQGQAVALQSGPVGAPLISPEEGAHRGGGGAAKEEEPAETGDEVNEGDGTAQPVDPGTAPPEGGEQPPADPGAGGGAEPDPGDGNGGGGDPGGGEAIDVH